MPGDSLALPVRLGVQANQFLARTAILLATAILAAPMAAANPLPVEAFYRHADLDEAKLSPSGRWLALSTAGGGSRVALFAIDLLEKEAPRQIVRFAEADVLDFYWVNDDRLVFRVIDRDSGGGDQRYGAGLFSVGRDGADIRLLIRLRRDFVTERRIGREPLEWNHTLLFVPQTGGDEVVVGELQFDAGNDLELIAPKRLNVVTQNVTSLAAGAPVRSLRWLFDPAGEPRLVESVNKGQTDVYWRAAGKAEWSRIASHPTLNTVFTPRFVDGSGALYVTVEEGPARVHGLRRFDFAAGRAEPEAIVRTPGFDFNGSFIMGSVPPRILGVRGLTDAEFTHWFDPRLQQMQKLVDTKLPGRINRVSCSRCSAAEMVILVRSWSDQEPGSLWIYRAAVDKWQPIGRVRKDIEPAQMATMDLHRYRARDGLEIPVWVTLPKRPALQAPGAAVVLVHGGPWLRGGSWRWNADAQFLASRGYVVIEPEFRGSLGYGQAHHVAGRKQWGLAMQDDLADAVQWAVGKGWVDRKRVCIAGGSYGGYATLMGLIRHPETYRCGAAWIAVTDPRLLFQWHWSGDIFEEQRRYQLPSLIGDPVTDAAALAALSLPEQAARIKAPVLLAYGVEDRRVPLEHGTRMREALRAAGREPEWVLYPDEGHGWLKAENRIDFARRLERFLAEHLR